MVRDIKFWLARELADLIIFLSIVAGLLLTYLVATMILVAIEKRRERKSRGMRIYK